MAAVTTVPAPVDVATSGDLVAAARAAMDEKTKPVGSLGHLETIAVRIAALQGTLMPEISRARIVVFAADHGVAADGVSAYPPQVTAEMMRNFARGGAAVCVLARASGVDVEVVDVGVDADFAAELDALAAQCETRIVHGKVRRGTRNLRLEPAMTAAECDAAMEIGRATVRMAAAEGVRALGLGEMGIGNTTSASALLCALTSIEPEEAVGRGTGVDSAGVARKCDVVRAALSRHDGSIGDPRRALAAVGGLELAAIAGAVLEAPRHGIAVMADGFISSVAALAAVRIDPTAARALLVAHRSAERGHGVVLDALGERPLLDLEMRLGEGSGAALALPILRAAAAILREMATFAHAGVSGRVDGDAR